MIGTHFYMSPEIFSNTPYDQKVSLDKSPNPAQCY
jgi:hypothetical protein